MKLKLIIGCATVAVLSSCSHLGQNELRSYSPRAEEIRAAMNRTVIPEIDLENVKAEDALNIWSEKSRTYHPQHFRFKHIVSDPMTFSQGTAKPAASRGSAQTVTVRRRNITSKQLLDEICQQSNLTWTIAGRVILVRPRGSPPNGQ